MAMYNFHWKATKIFGKETKECLWQLVCNNAFNNVFVVKMF